MKKTAIITGASRGIGEETAKIFAENFNVVVNYKNSKEKAEQLVKSLNEKGFSAISFCCDVSNRNEVKKMVEETIRRFGGIDVLVNNAGIAEQKVFGDITSLDWQKMIDVNLTGVFNCTQEVLPHMIKVKRGTIINVSSVWGICGASCEVHYSTTKAAIIGFTKALAKELAPSNITVNCVAPGVINTDMCNFDTETILELEKEIPLNSLGKPKEVASVIKFLASKNASYITGEVINVSGGFLI